MAHKHQLTTGYGYNHLEPGHPDNPTTYRICGAHTRSRNNNDLCTRPAGWGTSHAGAGRCKLHGGSNLQGPDNGRYVHGRYAKLFRGRLADHYNQVASDDDDPLDLVPELHVQRTMLSLAIDRLQHVAARQPDGTDNCSYLNHDGEADALDPRPADDRFITSASSLSAPLTSQGDQGGVGGGSNEYGLEDSTSLDTRGRLVCRYDGTVGERCWGVVEEVKGVEVCEGHRRVVEEDGGKYKREYWVRRGNKRREVGEIVEGIKRGVGEEKLLVSEEELKLVLEYSNAIVATVGKMEAIRNQSALTKAEVIYLMASLRELIGEYIPDVGRRREFIKRLMEKVPMGEEK